MPFIHFRYNKSVTIIKKYYYRRFIFHFLSYLKLIDKIFKAIFIQLFNQQITSTLNNICYFIHLNKVSISQRFFLFRKMNLFLSLF